MTWTEPIYDRVLADVQDQTAKGFFNVVDWVRVTGNAEVVGMLASVLKQVDIDLTTLPEATTATIPDVDDINAFVENIERLRLGAGVPAAVGLVQVSSFSGGANGTTPDYEDVNDWERNLALLKQYVITSAGYMIFCGVGASGQARFWQVRFRSVFPKDADEPVRRPRTGVAVTGADPKRQNKFRRYA